MPKQAESCGKPSCCQTILARPENMPGQPYGEAARQLTRSETMSTLPQENLCSAPLHIQQCQEAENNQTTPTRPDKCIEPENHSNSILALDINTGKITWYKQLGGYDVWFGACNWHLNPNCPPGPSPDAGFAEAPMMLSIYM
ncbi:hypothetical protein Q3G72_019926 [Acer saccharum]|nr:hypothetical protein Q3G72_019926 [Acer saccharum]